MPSITLKNIPEELYRQLKLRAKQSHRSINGEILHCLEQSLRGNLLSAEEKLDMVRRYQIHLDPEDVLPPDEMKAAMREGLE